MPSDENEPSESIQDILADAMPPRPEDGREFDESEEFKMTTDEQREITDFIEGIVQQLYDLGYSPNELGVIFSGFSHRMNAARYRPYEFDRIALTIQLRETIEAWRDEHDEDVPEVVIAEAVEELGRVYRHTARRELYTEDDDGE